MIARVWLSHVGALAVVSATFPLTVIAAHQRAQAASPRAAAHAAPGRALRNPRKLSAIQLLEPTHPGRTPHVRFEWDPVPDAREYVLFGQWVSEDSWTVQTREFHVTPRTATIWDAERIAFDAALPEGSHSWNLVALYAPNNGGDFETPTLLSFELR